MQRRTKLWDSVAGKILLVGGGLAGLILLCFVCAAFSVIFGSNAPVTPLAIEATVQSTPTRRNTPQPTATPQPTFTPEPTATLELQLTPPPTDTPLPTTLPLPITPSPPTATPEPIITNTPLVRISEGDIDIYSGPGTGYELIAILRTGQSVEITGRTADASWWQVAMANGPAWIEANVVDAGGFVHDIPVVETPETPPENRQTIGETPANVSTSEAPATASTEAAGHIVIAAVNDDDEYVDLKNEGDEPIDLSGWTLVSEKGKESCVLEGTIQPGEILRIWALANAAGRGRFDCGFGENIWDDTGSDPAVLYDPTGLEVARGD